MGTLGIWLTYVLIHRPIYGTIDTHLDAWQEILFQGHL